MTLLSELSANLKGAGIAGSFLRGLAAGGAGGGGYSGVVLADTPISYWRLEETEGLVVADEMGVTDGDINGGVDLNTSGLVGSAGGFNGIDGYIDVGPLSETHGALSFEAFVKTTATSLRQIICGDHWVDTFGNRGPQFRVDPSGVVTAIKIRGTTVSATGVTPINDGEFHHVVMSYDGVTLKVYVDGVEDASAAASGDIAVAGYPLWIGANERNGGEGFWDGVIDEPAVYNYALTAEQVANHYNASGLI